MLARIIRIGLLTAKATPTQVLILYTDTADSQSTHKTDDELVLIAPPLPPGTNWVVVFNIEGISQFLLLFIAIVRRNKAYYMRAYWTMRGCLCLLESAWNKISILSLEAC